MNLNIHFAASKETPLSKANPVSKGGMVSTQKLMVGIVIVATLLRVASAFYQGNTVADLPGIYDQISYDGLARRVVDGYGFAFAEGHWPATRAGEPTAHWSYLYTLYLTVIYAIVGKQAVVARLVQALLAGVLHPWLAWRIGRRVFGATTGLVAAAISALYIYFFYYAGALITETFYIIAILWTFDVALRLILPATEGEKPPAQCAWLWVELGVALGVTALLRQVFLLFAPFLYLWLWWFMPHPQLPTGAGSALLQRLRWSTVRGLIGATLIVVLLILPWTIRNYRAFGTIVLLNTNAGFAFFWGNHPIYGTHFVGILPANGPSYYDLIPKELLPLNEAELDRALLKRGIGFITADPRRYVLLSLSRFEEYFKFWPSSDSGLVSNLSRIGSFGLCLPFMVYGLVLSLGLLWRPQQEGQCAGLILFYLFIVIYAGVHLLTWALIRYRLPVDAVLISFAAFGLVDLAKRFFLSPHLASVVQQT
ncbi:MAG: hypothetical protein U0350_09750 [Caldilineaceae bacterium]